MMDVGRRMPEIDKEAVIATVLPVFPTYNTDYRYYVEVKIWNL